jgi:Flp pilus assembly protein TadD
VLAPGEPQVLNNLGLSYLLTNELAEAEKVLREAAASPRATLKVKQNLALVLRLQGKGGEASEMSGAPQTNAVEPLQRQTAGQANTWNELAKI